MRCQSFDGGAEDGAGKTRLQGPLDDIPTELHRLLAMDVKVSEVLESVNKKHLVEPVVRLDWESLDNYMKDVSDAEQEMQTAVKLKFDQAVMYGIKRGAWTTLTCHGATGVVQIQGEGSRVMAMARMDEVSNAFGGTFKDAIAGWESLSTDAEDRQVLDAIPSLVTFILVTGDVLMIPPGYLITEKAVGCHNFGVRVPSHFIFLKTMDGVTAIHDMNHIALGPAPRMTTKPRDSNALGEP